MRQWQVDPGTVRQCERTFIESQVQRTSDHGGGVDEALDDIVGIVDRSAPGLSVVPAPRRDRLAGSCPRRPRPGEIEAGDVRLEFEADDPGIRTPSIDRTSVLECFPDGCRPIERSVEDAALDIVMLWRLVMIEAAGRDRTMAPKAIPGLGMLSRGTVDAPDESALLDRPEVPRDEVRQSYRWPGKLRHLLEIAGDPCRSVWSSTRLEPC